MPAAKPLTVKSIEAIKAGSSRREIPDGALQGLYLIVQTTGVKSWAVRYRHAGKPRKMTLGGFPAISLSDAREEARKALRMVSEGRDPATEKAEQEPKRPAHMDLMPALLDEFVTRHVAVKNRPSYVRESKRIVEKNLKPKWKQKLVKTVTKRDVLKLLDEIVDRGSPIMANRVRALLSKFFAWAMERDIVDASPVVSIKAPSEEKTRDRILTDEEIRFLWLAAEKLAYPFGPVVKLLLLTAQRRTEVSDALWDELELEGNNQLWVISVDRAKNKKEHFVPLTASALEIIEGLPKIKPAEDEKAKPIYLFTTTGKTPVSGFSKAKTQLDGEMLAIARKEAEERGEDPEGISIEPWTYHDLRRTAASGMARLSVPVHIVEAVLNHRSGSIKGVAAVYNRYDYAEEKRAALTAWADEVLRLVGRAAPEAGAF
ncbi:DNA integration/recombination/invertion protein [Sinorhizobium fredii NGR234]|uniref:DNA integration/recombination/invertion protein n=1 Tax=Sinorhizobium fredii (strain NBRC 101917 / NGR234) TaxID=394 RepID=C3MAV8_SINFN|nr:site-specific integrase [Sinorhizobium fredii]ACP24951.1 DNA integration/recombination/invertion protein [Sinorhizobium fredii NGR234]